MDKNLNPQSESEGLESSCLQPQYNLTLKMTICNWSLQLILSCSCNKFYD
jgi:hypothetical protein